MFLNTKIMSTAQERIEKLKALIKRRREITAKRAAKQAEIDRKEALKRERAKLMEMAIEARALRAKEREERKEKALQERLAKKAAKQAEKERLASMRKLTYGRWFDVFDRDCDLYETRKQLIEAQAKGEGGINWEAWDKHVAACKKMLQL